MNRVSENMLAELKRKNIKLSHQRLIILAHLIDNKNHPTVDQIYNDLKPTIPTLSKTTIYNTLNLFIEGGIVRALNIEDNEIRHDIVTKDHGHFKCMVCGEIKDMDVDVNLAADTEAMLADYEIKQKDIYFKGICPSCLSAEKL